MKKARQFFELIAPQTDDVTPKLVTYIDVRRLKIIVSNPLAFEALLDPDRTFREVLQIAEPELKLKLSFDPTVIKNYSSFINSITIDTLMSLTADHVELLYQILNKTKELLDAREKLLK